MASVHRFPGEKGNILKKKPLLSKNKAIEIEYKLSIKAIRKSKFDILGHPFGMSIKRFKAKPSWILFRKIIKECKKTVKFLKLIFIITEIIRN